MPRARSVTEGSPGTVAPAQTLRLELPYSEVMMHMRVAGQIFDVEILAHGMAQLWKDGRRFSFPVLQGEAGVPAELRI